MMNSLRWLVMLVALVCMAGCGETESPPVDSDTVDTDGSGDVRDGDGTDADAVDTDTAGGDEAAPGLGAVLVGTWDAVEGGQGALPSGTLVFTYRADGTGEVVEEGGPPKTYTWVHDVDAGTLHVLTENEDLLFDATFEGDTLTLVMGEGDQSMRLVMRRLDDAGE